MSFPTVLGPWYVVQRLVFNADDQPTHMEYYQFDPDTGAGVWSSDKKRALLHMSLSSASQVALAEVAEVRVLFTKEDAKEFDRA